MLIIKIETDNAAFTDGNKGAETARILRKLADELEEGIYNNTLMDVNGNRVGYVKEVE